MIDDDPGWGSFWRTLLMAMPGVGLLYLRRSQSRAQDGLVTLRQVFIAFCQSIVGFGIVLAVLYRSARQPRHAPTGIAIGLLVVGGLSALVGPRLERPLDCTDDAALAGSYRTRFFLRIASSEVAALFGFVAFFLTYFWWTYPVGAAIAGIGFARAAPTAKRLSDDQEVLAASGCPRSLVHALRVVPPSPGGPGRFKSR